MNLDSGTATSQTLKQKNMIIENPTNEHVLKPLVIQVEEVHTCSAEAQPQVVGSALLRITLSILH